MMQRVPQAIFSPLTVAFSLGIPRNKMWLADSQLKLSIFQLLQQQIKPFGQEFFFIRCWPNSRCSYYYLGGKQVNYCYSKESCSTMEGLSTLK